MTRRRMPVSMSGSTSHACSRLAQTRKAPARTAGFRSTARWRSRTGGCGRATRSKLAVRSDENSEWSCAVSQTGTCRKVKPAPCTRTSLPRRQPKKSTRDDWSGCIARRPRRRARRTSVNAARYGASRAATISGRPRRLFCRANAENSPQRARHAASGSPDESDKARSARRRPL